MDQKFNFDKFLERIREEILVKQHDEKRVEDTQKPMNLFNGFMMTPRVLSKEEIEFNRKHG